MAKYELITVTHFEDNEEAADAQQQQAFVEDWAQLCVEHWHRSQVKMRITQNGMVNEYNAEVKNGPTKPSEGQEKRPAHRWPWMRATLLMPEVGQNIVVYNAETDFISFGMLRPAEDNPTKDGGAFFHCYTNDGQEIGYFQPEFPNLYWRTVEKPIIEDIH